MLTLYQIPCAGRPEHGSDVSQYPINKNNEQNAPAHPDAPANSWRNQQHGNQRDGHDHQRIEPKGISDPQVQKRMDSSERAAARALQTRQDIKRATRIKTRCLRIEGKQETCTQNRSKNAANQKRMPFIAHAHFTFHLTVRQPRQESGRRDRRSTP